MSHNLNLPVDFIDDTIYGTNEVEIQAVLDGRKPMCIETFDSLSNELKVKLNDNIATGNIREVKSNQRTYDTRIYYRPEYEKWAYFISMFDMPTADNTYYDPINKKYFCLMSTMELKCQDLINIDQVFIRHNLPAFDVIKSPHIFDSTICITYLIGKLLGYSDGNICKYVCRVNYHGQQLEEQKKFAYDVLDRLCRADQ